MTWAYNNKDDDDDDDDDKSTGDFKIFVSR